MPLPLRKLMANLGLMGPATSFKRGLMLHRDARPSGLPSSSAASNGGRRARGNDLFELAGAGAGYALRAPESLRYFSRGYRYGQDMASPELTEPTAASADEQSALTAYFDTHTEGLSIFKRRHYLGIYDRHLARFRGKRAHIVEIGVMGGGSLEMWRDYLGPDARVFGIDRDPACKQREGEGIEIFIGDQADPEFWAQFLERVSDIDIVVDDGGHKPDQQAVTLECLLPHIKPGGVYICEDIGGAFQPFQSFVDGLTRPLSAIALPGSPTPVSPLQQHIASVHRYPLMTVIEKPASIPVAFEASRRGGATGPS